MALCESRSLVLREGQLYTFRKVGDCEKCEAMSKASFEAYGEPPAPAQKPAEQAAPSEALARAMELVQAFGDAMLKRGILSSTTDAKGYARSFDETAAAKVAVLNHLSQHLRAPGEDQQ